MSQVLGAMAAPILTRLYRPEDLGVLSVFSAVLAIVLVSASLKYEGAIPLPQDDAIAANLVVLASSILLVACLLVGVGIWFGGEVLIIQLNAPQLAPYSWMLPFSLLFAGAYQILNLWALRRRAFGHIARSKISQTGGLLTAQISLGFTSGGPLGLLVGDIVGLASGSGILGSFLWRCDRGILKRVTWASISDAARRYRRFPLYSSGAGILNTTGLQAPPLLLAAFYGTDTAGLFAIGNFVLGIPSLLVGSAVGQVYLAEASRLRRENPGELLRLFQRTTRKLMWLSVGPFVLIALAAPFCFALIFGEPWREAGEYVRMISIAVFAGFVVVPVSATLTILERQDWQIVWDASRLVLVVSALVGAKELDLSARGAVTAYGLAMLLAYLVYYTLSKIAITREPSQT